MKEEDMFWDELARFKLFRFDTEKLRVKIKTFSSKVRRWIWRRFDKRSYEEYESNTLFIKAASNLRELFGCGSCDGTGQEWGGMSDITGYEHTCRACDGRGVTRESVKDGLIALLGKLVLKPDLSRLRP